MPESKKPSNFFGTCSKARQKRRFKKTTGSNHGGPVAPHHLDWDFAATAPDQKWAADIGYIRTAEGWLSLAIVLDLFSRRIVSRRIVGWALTRPPEKRSGAFRVASGRSSCASQRRAFRVTPIVAASLAHIITGGCWTGTASSPR